MNSVKTQQFKNKSAGIVQPEQKLELVRPNRKFQLRRKPVVSFFTSGMMHFGSATKRMIDFNRFGFIRVNVERSNPANKSLYIVFYDKPVEDSIELSSYLDDGYYYTSLTSLFRDLNARGYLRGYMQRVIHYAVVLSSFQGQPMFVLNPVD